MNRSNDFSAAAFVGANPWQPVGGSNSGLDNSLLTLPVNGRNELAGILTSDGSANTTKQTRFDSAGNLTFDGVYFYQYDAWNRLVQVNLAHLGSGTLGSEPIVADALVKHYTYDGLGRMVRVVTPYPSPSTSNYQLRTNACTTTVDVGVVDPVSYAELSRHISFAH